MPNAEEHKEPKPRPYAHLTVDELRKVEDLTDEEWFDELEARGIITPPKDPTAKIMPPKRPLPPGALERFLKERG